MDCRHLALFCDLDGSLLNSAGHVTKKSNDAIRAFMRDGGLFGLCTGRATGNARAQLPDLSVNAPSVLFNGAAVYDYTTATYLDTHYVDQQAALQTIKWAMARDPYIDVQVYTQDEIIYVSDRKNADKAFLQIHLPCRFADVDAITNLAWIKCLLYSKGGTLSAVETFVRESGFASCMELVHSATDIADGAYYLELVPRNCDKGTALKTICDLPVIQGRTVAALGDYFNDLPFLKIADYAFVPANAPEEIRRIAYRVVPPNNEDPVCAIFKTLYELPAQEKNK